MEKIDAGITANRAITAVYWMKSWIPFARDACGNYYCVDLDPTSEGAPGQIIGMWLVPPERSLLGGSIGEWFQRYVARVLTGDYAYSKDWDGLVEIED
jgi:cell wall assembly regulator SMI1